MEISSVKTPPAQQAQRPKRAEETQQAQSNDPYKSTQTNKPPEHKPTPVVNTQGQTTGRLLNVTA